MIYYIPFDRFMASPVGEIYSGYIFHITYKYVYIGTDCIWISVILIKYTNYNMVLTWAFLGFSDT